jgi:hypothetical protein
MILASPTPVMEQLGDATRDLHAQLEALPFVVALLEGRLPLESYVGQLRALAILHGVLERALTGLTHPAIKAVWEEGMKRLPLLENDLAYFQPRSKGDACEAFEGLARVFRALYPVNQEALRTLVTSLNPEAGSHPIPSDPRELQAAVRAGERCWQRFPYFSQRYGHRGEKFTSSDSAWLVTLVEYDQARVHQQVAWLGQVLAARGMPRLLLETHWSCCTRN